MNNKKKDPTDLLKEIDNAERGLLGGIYNDLYGTGTDSPSTEKTPGSGDDSTKGASGFEEKIPSEEEALQNANRALEEVKKLFGSGDGNMETAAIPAAEEPPKEKEPEEDPMEQLDKLIGLSTIKHDVKELTAFVKIQKQRAEEGLRAVPVSLHLVFTGNPGTGKTTVARILAKLYRQIGVLSQGQLVEVDRSGLVAGYVGQTALKTQEKIKEALGGVLFIDEAYALAQKDDAFGQEAIDTILKAMEDNRDNLVVIVAGYTEPMEKFINSNPGLKSRFNKYIEFPDYTIDELEQIFYMNCNKYDYTVEEDAKLPIRELITTRKLTRRENFANAREVRNLFEEIITNQARRLSQMEAPSQDDMRLLTTWDLSDDEAEEKPLSEDKVDGNFSPVTPEPEDEK